MGEAAGNGVRACKLSGYRGSDKALAVQASGLIRRPHIREAIAARADEDPLIMGRVERQRFWSQVARGEIGTPTNCIDENGKPVIVTDMPSRLRGSELLAKSQGDFVDRVEHTGKDGGPIETKAGLSDEAAELLRRKILGVSE